MPRSALNGRARCSACITASDGSATAHRAQAYEACRYAIERVKQILPVWKHEFFEDGEAWVEGAVADPDDEDARQAAVRRAGKG
jgi:hypothetical protein